MLFSAARLGITSRIVPSGRPADEEVLDRLGLVPKHRWLNELGERCLGAHVHDVDGLADHRAPGLGDVDWSYIARGLPPDAPRVFEINPKQPEEAVAAAIPFLRERGVLASSPRM